MGHRPTRRPALAVAGLAAIALAAAAPAQTVLYVDDDASPGGNGLTWATAYTFLQDGLAHAAGSGGAVNEIRVAQGIYQPDRDELNPLGTGDRAATFQLISGVALRGGYAGPGAPDPDARDIALYETILSGDLLGDDQPDFVGSGENSWHVVTGSDTDATAVLDGFTITAGNANDLDALPSGAGILNVQGDPTVISCAIVRNRAAATCTLFPCGAGGGMFNSGSSPTVAGCLFTGNVADWAGGGMYNVESTPVVDDCVFNANQVEGENGFFGGGGILNSGGSLIMDRCTLTVNTAIRGGGINNSGGALFLTACTFDENSASADGGAVRNFDGVLIATDCSFTANTAGLNGGAVINDGTAKCSLSDSRFHGNAAAFGGGLHGESGAVNVSGCSFIGNAAVYSGGGAFGPGEDVIRIGASLFCENTPAHLGGHWIDEGGNDLCPPCDPSSGSRLDVPAQYPTIQAAIAAACDGAEIVVAPGTYFERINFAGKAITLRSSHGAEVTIIDGLAGDDLGSDGPASGPVVVAVDFDNAETLLEGFTIRNGVAPYGAGMYIWGGSPHIIDCIFIANTADDDAGGSQGGGLYALESNPVIRGCAFIDNFADVHGGGAYVDSGDASLTDCSFEANESAYGGGLAVGGGVVALTNCTFAGNQADQWGGGLRIGHGKATAVNCLFTENQGFAGGALNFSFESLGSLVNCTLASNQATYGSGIACGQVWPHPDLITLANCILVNQGPEIAIMDGGDSTVIATYSNIEGGWPGEGVISADPQLASDYRLGHGRPGFRHRAGRPRRNRGHPGTADGAGRVGDVPVTRGRRHALT